MTILKRGLSRGIFKLTQEKTELAVTVKSTGRPILSASLQSGMPSSNDVLLLELRLKSFGYFSEVADKIFDAQTTDSVKNFQNRFGLGDDGIVGSATWAALWPALSEAKWIKAWNVNGKLDVRAMSGDKCLFKVESSDTASVVEFMNATIGAATVAAGGEKSASEDSASECPDYRELYDLKTATVQLSGAPAAQLQGTDLTATWHKLYRGAADEWILSSFNGGAFVNSIATKSKAEALTHIRNYSRALRILPALNTETPIRQ